MAQTDLSCWRAVSFEGVPRPFVFAVNKKILLDVQGLKQLLGSLCLYPSEQNLSSKVHLGTAKSVYKVNNAQQNPSNSLAFIQ